jgi:DNA-binding beta-propeller fold protein YncE
MIRAALFASAAILMANWVQADAAPEIAFDSTPNFFKLPAGVYFGEVSGVAVNSKKHIFILSRANPNGPAYGAAAAALYEFDATGKFVREIGHGLYAWSFAHAVRVDREDNIWVADKGSDMVVRFDPEGRVVMVFGRKVEASDESAHPLEHPKPPLPAVNGYFRQVTDMAWDSNNNVFISDGYINSRVAEYNRDGDWVKTWGEFGTAPGQFNALHSIVIDHDNHIYVADRGNARIQVFDTSGKLLSVLKIDVPVPPNTPPAIGNQPAEAGSMAPGTNLLQTPGAPWALCLTPGSPQYLYVADAYPGRIYKLSTDGKVLGWLGGSGKTLKKFGWIHELACPSENEIYAAEILNWRAQKLTLHP